MDSPSRQPENPNVISCNNKHSSEKGISIVRMRPINQSPTKYRETSQQDSIVSSNGFEFDTQLPSNVINKLNPVNFKRSLSDSSRSSQFSSIGYIASTLIQNKIQKLQAYNESLTDTRIKEGEHLLPPQNTSSDNVAPTQRPEGLAKRHSVQPETENEKRQVELHDHYRLVLTSAHMIFSFMNNIQYCMDSTMPTKMDLMLYRYIITLKALSTLMELEKLRRKQQFQILHGKYNKTVDQCHGFIKWLFKKLIELRDSLDQTILEVCQQGEIKKVAQRILDEPDKTYTAFKPQELQAPFRKLTEKIYVHICDTFQKTRQESHLRLGLLNLFCMEYKRIFCQKDIPIAFNEYFKYNKQIMRQSIQGYDLEDYLMTAPITSIHKHHQDLKQWLGVSRRKILNS